MKYGVVKKSIFLLALAAALIVVVGASSRFAARKSGSRIQPPEAVLQEGLSAAAYQALREELASVLFDQDPQTAIEMLKTKMAANPAVSHSCHELLHELGFAAVEKYKDFATVMQYRDEVCISGYVHGALEAYFLRAPDALAALQDVCQDSPAGTALAWQCYHGTGHGAMYYLENDLPAALDQCDLHASLFARSACANGAYMEHFNADGPHPSAYLKEDDLSYPCAEFGRYPGDCYVNAPIYYLRLHHSDYRGALEWCAGADQPYQQHCYQGVGFEAAKRHIADVAFIKALCAYGGPRQEKSCITGAVFAYLGYYASQDEAQALCGVLEGPRRGYCREAVQNALL